MRSTTRRRVLFGLLAFPFSPLAKPFAAIPSAVVSGVDVGADRLTTQLWIDPRILPGDLGMSFDAWQASKSFVVASTPRG